MKSLIISLLIVFVSIFGLKATSEVSEEKARSKDGQMRIVMAEERFQLTTGTNLEQINSPFDEVTTTSQDREYIPTQFHFLKEEDNNQLIYRFIFDILLNKNKE